MTKRRSLRSGLCWLVLFALAVPLSAQQGREQGVLSGLLLDPTGQPASGFQLVFRAEQTGAEFTSPPSDGLGKYSITLPAGTSYTLIGAVAPDGTKMTVPDLPPIPVEAGTRRLDVRFGKPALTQEPPPPGGWRDLPWWQIGTGLTAVIVVWSGLDGGTEQRASPFRP